MFFITDGDTHFRCSLFRELETLFGFNHHIVSPYCQWGNGGTERLGRLMVKAFLAILADRQTDHVSWPQYTAAVNETANKVMKVSRRGHKTIVELLTDIVSCTVTQRIVSLGVDTETTKADVVSGETLEAALDELHETMESLWTKAVVSQHKHQQVNACTKTSKHIHGDQDQPG